MFAALGGSGFLGLGETGNAGIAAPADFHRTVRLMPRRFAPEPFRLLRFKPPRIANP